jgi:hypothetical protein
MESAGVIPSFWQSDKVGIETLQTFEQSSVQPSAEPFRKFNRLLVVQQLHYIFHAVADRPAMATTLEVLLDLRPKLRGEVFVEVVG